MVWHDGWKVEGLRSRSKRWGAGCCGRAQSRTCGESSAQCARLSEGLQGRSIREGLDNEQQVRGTTSQCATLYPSVSAPGVDLEHLLAAGSGGPAGVSKGLCHTRRKGGSKCWLSSHICPFLGEKSIWPSCKSTLKSTRACLHACKTRAAPAAATPLLLLTDQQAQRARCTCAWGLTPNDC